MQQFFALNQLSLLKTPVVVTIGTFDGVHLGHQALFAAMQQGYRLVITFTTSPKAILGHQPYPQITSMKHKLSLLQRYGIDGVLLLSFETIQEQTAQIFLQSIKNTIDMRHLVLGEGARLGYQRHADASELSYLGQMMGFTVEYTALKQIEGITVSSSIIRSYITQGLLAQASLLLGRPYTIYGVVQAGAQQGRQLSTPTLNIDVDELVMPPLGVYVVSALIQGISYQAVANLGTAPTLHKERKVLLEVHLLNPPEHLHPQEIEIEFHKFIRHEHCFTDVSALKQRIQADIHKAKKFFNDVKTTQYPLLA